MKGLLKQAALSVLSSSPTYGFLQRRFLRDHPVTILCYHTLGPEDETMDAWTVLCVADFREQLAFLREHYDIVSLDEALSHPAPNSRPKAVLTFDDGDVGLFNHLLPIIETEAIPVTVYIATAQIVEGRAYWFDRVMNALQGQQSVDIDLRHAGLSKWSVGPQTGAARWLVISDILENLKRLPPDQRETLAQDVVAQSGPSQRAFTALQPMTIKQLQALAANPLVTIGAHSHCHNLLDQIPINEARGSIDQSRELLQDWTGQPVRHFAYPNGNMNAALQDSLESLGFATGAALTAEQDGESLNAFALLRISIGRYDDIKRFRLRLVGF
ncbi:polysaccharide deacetylase family protein [Roseovarius sp. Pro17]|uniref:polysaccharide deacetylase family protein n=1 Tax=Roseovarius sp. Pro17 TaxID=3108175 RepID=UPI002D7A1E04|nr:polysaccharide deacetylase family protein [Roseovarius sp. Pro17]